MMISTKGRYALRFMIDLGQHPGTAVPLKDTAERQGISKKYLEILAKDLVQAGFLRGVSGKGGGYRLARDPSAYSVYEILTVMEGTLAPVACLADGAEACPRAGVCATLPLWTEFDRVIREFFGSRTLADLVESAAEGVEK